MNDCVFCRIVEGDIPCFKIWENDEFLAFLDINPITEGMTLVIPKEHKDSDVSKNDDITICSHMKAIKEVSKLLKNSLDIERVAVIFEGLEVSHLHAKLVPIRGGENLKTLINSNLPRPNSEELEETALRINGIH